MLRRGLSRLSQRLITRVSPVSATVVMGLGACLAAYHEAKHYQPKTPPSNIHAKLGLKPEQIQSILMKEKTRREQVKKELAAMKPLWSKKQIEQQVEKIAGEVAVQFKEEEHLLVLTMLNGANYFATHLKEALHEKGLLFKEEAIHVTRYGNEMHGGKVSIERMPTPEKVVGRKILIVEDLAEKGITLQATKEELIKLGAKAEDIYVAVLTDKVNARAKGYEGVVPNFKGFEMRDNQWIVGYGCDQAGYARPAQGISYFPEDAQKSFGYSKL